MTIFVFIVITFWEFSKSIDSYCEILKLKYKIWRRGQLTLVVCALWLLHQGAVNEWHHAILWLDWEVTANRIYLFLLINVYPTWGCDYVEEIILR